LDGDDDWLHGHLGSDHHGRHLTTDSLLDPATGTMPYLYGKQRHHLYFIAG